VTPTDFMFEVYLRLLYRLRAYANRYVDLETASRCARATVAGVLSDALYGLATEFGIHQRAYELLSGTVRLNLPLDTDVWVMGVMGDAPLPDHEEICDLSRAYAVVYSTAHHAQLTVAERAQLVALVQLCDPPARDGRTLDVILASKGGVLDPLRRCFYAVEEHDCSNDLICGSADVLRHEETIKAERWVEHMCKRREAV
jgi:hypothetical protein